MKKITTALAALLLFGSAAIAQPYSKNDNNFFEKERRDLKYDHDRDNNDHDRNHRNKKDKHHGKNCNRGNNGKHLGQWKNGQHQSNNNYPNNPFPPKNNNYPR